MKLYVVNGSEGYGFVVAKDDDDVRRVWTEEVEDAQPEAWDVLSEETGRKQTYCEEDEPDKPLCLWDGFVEMRDAGRSGVIALSAGYR